MSKLSEAQAALDALTVEQDQLADAIRARGAEIANLEGQIVALQANPRASSADLATLSQQLQTARQMFTSAHTQAGQLVERIRHQHEYLAEIDVQAGRLRREIATLETDLRAAETRVADAVRMRDSDWTGSRRAALRQLQAHEATLPKGGDKAQTQRDIRVASASLASIDARAVEAETQIETIRRNTAAFIQERRARLAELVGA